MVEKVNGKWGRQAGEMEHKKNGEWRAEEGREENGWREVGQGYAENGRGTGMKGLGKRKGSGCGGDMGKGMVDFKWPVQAHKN